MDILFSITSGLFLRISSHGIHTEPLGKIASALVGVWEGVIVHQMSSRASSELDHYLAYGLRLVIDFTISRDPTRAILLLIWTALGAFASELVTPRAFLRKPSSKRDRRSRSSRARQSGTRRTGGRPGETSTSTALAPNLPLFPPNARATPPYSVTKPPSPPSCFLEADSDVVLSPIPLQLHPLDLSPTRPPTGLATQLEKDDGPEGSGKPGLPTPPNTQSTHSDGLERSRPTPSPNRLSTIQEISSAAERTPQQTEAFKPLPPASTSKPPTQDPASAVQSTNPSTRTSPIPVPNLTMQGFSLSNIFNANGSLNDMSSTDSMSHSTPFASGPVPVPNAGSTVNWEPHMSDKAQPGNDDTSPPWDNGDDLDELRTPLMYSSGDSTATRGRVEDIGDDPLRTPFALSNTGPHMLSPLVLEEDLAGSGVPLVSVIDGPIPSITQIQALGQSAAPISAATTRGAGVAHVLAAGPSTLLGGSANASGAATVVPPTPASPAERALTARDHDTDTDHGALTARETTDTERGARTAHNGETTDTERGALTANDFDDPPSDQESVFSAPEPKALTRKADKMRQDAREAEKEWAEMKKKWQTAVFEGRTAEAFVLKRRMYDAEEKAKELHKKAAKRYYASLNDLNPKQKEGTIDVHGLRPGEAIDRVERALSHAIEDGLTFLRVIVGKGLHSVNGQPVLKSVVKQNLERQKVDCVVDPKNTGVLILTVPTA